jgi:hypothetical protein
MTSVPAPPTTPPQIQTHLEQPHLECFDITVDASEVWHGRGGQAALQLRHLQPKAQPKAQSTKQHQELAKKLEAKLGTVRPCLRRALLPAVHSTPTCARPRHVPEVRLLLGLLNMTNLNPEDPPVVELFRDMDLLVTFWLHFPVATDGKPTAGAGSSSSYRLDNGFVQAGWAAPAQQPHE